MNDTKLTPPPIPNLEIGELAPASDSRRFPVIERKHIRWVAVLVPWFWFLIRGVHPILEIVAVALPLLIAMSLVVALHLAIAHRSALWMGCVASLALFFISTVVLPMRPTDRPEPINPFRVASINVGGVWFSDNDIGYLVSRQTPQLIVGSELAQSHDEELRDRFSHGVSEIITLEQSQANRDGPVAQTNDYRRYGLPSIGVYSDFPLTRMPDPIADEIAGGLPGIRVVVSTPDTDVMVYALHIPRPGTGDGIYEVSITEQSKMVEQIVRAIEEETLPVIVIGDLNVVDRSTSYRRLTGTLVDGMREERWAVPTRSHDFLYSLLLARVDHVLISDSLCVTGAETESLLFTDHTPIYAEIGLCELG